MRLSLHSDGPFVTARMSGTELPDPGGTVQVTVTGDVLACPGDEV